MLSKISSIRVKGSDPYGYTEGILKELRDRTKLEILGDIDLDTQDGNIVIYTAYNKTIIKPDFTYEIKSLTDYDREALKVISEQKRIIREAEQKQSPLYRLQYTSPCSCPCSINSKAN